MIPWEVAIVLTIVTVSVTLMLMLSNLQSYRQIKSDRERTDEIRKSVPTNNTEAIRNRLEAIRRVAKSGYDPTRRGDFEERVGKEIENVEAERAGAAAKAPVSGKARQRGAAPAKEQRLSDKELFQLVLTDEQLRSEKLGRLPDELLDTIVASAGEPSSGPARPPGRGQRSSGSP